MERGGNAIVLSFGAREHLIVFRYLIPCVC
jgi:hypothetical protein